MTNEITIRILVLDDEPFMLKLLGQMLANLGHASVTLCENGPAALKQVDHADSAPDLILLDLNMPEMDGAEFVRKLVEHHYTGSLILFSGEGERVLQSADNLVHAHKIPLLGHLQKPVTPEGLSALIGNWVPPSQSDSGNAKKVYRTDELRAAIANGELVNYYQPQVAVASGAVVGVEILARWRHPQYGMVLLEPFSGTAEAQDLTRAVLTGALAQANIWQDAGLSLRTAVNVSMDILTSLDFANFVVELVAAADVPPQTVVLEVQEVSKNFLTQGNMSAPLEVLTRLRLKHVRLSIDAFNTGDYSLAKLRDIPFDELKIDQRFVHGAWKDEKVREKFDACLALAKQLDMKVAADGIEDQDDWNFLRRTGCEFAQGNFVANPMPADDLPGWMADWEARRPELAPK